MIIYFFKSAWRILRKNKFFSFISILGLSIALGLSFIIIGFILFQLSFNKCYNYKQIYRVISVYERYNSKKYPEQPFVLASTLKNSFPEVEESGSIMNVPFLFSYVKVTKGKELIEEPNFYCADKEFFSIFNLPIKSKSKEEVLSDPYDIVLSESMAHKYFENNNPLGKTLVVRIYGKNFELNVSGIMEDFPANSSINADFFCTTDLILEIISHESNQEEAKHSWKESEFQTYLLFREKVDVKSFESKLNETLINLFKLKDIHFYLQNLGDIYFNSNDITNDLYIIKGDIQQVYLFSGIVIIILLIAVINYIILTTALSTLRYMELGLKKVFGMHKMRLIFQLMTESLLVSLISFIISLMFLWIVKDYVHWVIFNDLSFHLLLNWKVFAITFAITILTGLISGLYLAFNIASLKPVDALKKQISIQKRKFDIKIILIIFQLLAFIVLIIFSLFIYKQVRFALTTDLGFSKENLIIVRFDPKEFNGYQAYKNLIKQNPNVLSVSGAYFMPPANASTPIILAKPNDPSVEFTFENYPVDFGFFTTMGINIIEGREFDEENKNDRYSSIIINQKVVKDFEIKDPIGKKIGDKRIIGVAENIYMHSFHLELLPAIYFISPDRCMHIAIRTSPGQKEQVLAFLQDQWNKIAPNIPFRYYFIDNELKQFYKKDFQFGSSMNLYTLFAIFISLMGLFGLSLFISESKTKEIGIRKVLGASVSDIVFMLLKQFLKYALIANLIAIPLAYYLVDNWLQNFSVRLIILNNWWIFLMSGIISILIITCTVGFKAWQAAKMNPVITLKHE